MSDMSGASWGVFDAYRNFLLLSSCPLQSPPLPPSPLPSLLPTPASYLFLLMEMPEYREPCLLIICHRPSHHCNL